MKKIAFKISTYISIFLVLPILKLFGKKYYETNVVPKLLTVLCNTKPNHYQRKKVVPLATGDVVEIGVGPGLNLQYYNFEKVNKVIGIDPSGELNKIAKKNADKVNLDIEFNLSSAESIDLPTSSVDSVVCTFSLCSIPDPNKALNEIFRILKPGGKFYASVPASWPEKICWRLSKDYQNQPGGHLRIFNQGNFVSEIENLGFKFLFSEKFHSIHSPYWWLRCFFWSSQDSNIFVKLYKRILERHILKKPIIIDSVDKLLNPIIGKSFSMYFEKM